MRAENASILVALLKSIIHSPVHLVIVRKAHMRLKRFQDFSRLRLSQRDADWYQSFILCGVFVYSESVLNRMQQ